MSAEQTEIVENPELIAPVFPHHAAASAHADRLAAAFGGRRIGVERDRLDAQENARDDSGGDVGELAERCEGLS